MAKLNILLYEPEIPFNTGAIGRTCVATGTRLHLIEPLGFRLNEKEIKRAGMDYWNELDVTRYVNYENDCYIMFGKESAGIPEEILAHHKEQCIRIPMQSEIRSLNLSNSVAVVLYEALRQNQFENMQLEGYLTRFDDYIE